MNSTMLEMLIEFPRQLASSTAETVETVAAAQGYWVAVMDAADVVQRIIAITANVILAEV